MPSWTVLWVAVVIALLVGEVLGFVTASLCVVAGDADRQMERDLEERRCSEEVRYGQDQQQAQGPAGRA